MSASPSAVPDPAKDIEKPASIPDPCRDPNSLFFTDAPEHMQPVPIVFRIGMHWGCKRCKGMHTTRSTLFFSSASALKSGLVDAAESLADTRHHDEIAQGIVEVVAVKAEIVRGSHASRKCDEGLMGTDLMQLVSDVEVSEIGRILKVRAEQRKGRPTIVAITFQLKAAAPVRSPLSSVPRNRGDEVVQAGEEVPIDDEEQYKMSVEELEHLIKKEDDDEQ